MRNQAGTSKGICSYNLMYNFLKQLLPLNRSVFVVYFSNIFWDVKICFYSCRYQNQNFSLVVYSCRSCSTRVALVSFVQHLCRTSVSRVSLLLLVPHSCRICVALVAGTRVVNQTGSNFTNTSLDLTSNFKYNYLVRTILK